MTPVIRSAHARDVESINAIYNDAVAKTTATMDTEQRTVERARVWLQDHGGRYPVIVAEDPTKGVVGWASLSRWSDRPAYDGTAENSVYVAEPERGRGLGTRLLDGILNEGRKQGLHTVIARIAAGNDASVRLHSSAGFEMVGVMKEVGWKFNRRIDVIVMQRMYSAAPH